jgi:hypothetical protein
MPFVRFQGKQCRIGGARIELQKWLFATYRVVGSQLPTVACLIHAEARCVQMFCCSFATFWFFVGHPGLLLVIGPTTVSRVVEHKQHNISMRFLRYLVLKSVRRQD